MYIIQQCIVSASDAAADTRLPAVAALLQELEDAMDDMFSTGQARFSSPTRCPPALLVREQVLRSNSHAYLTHQLTTSSLNSSSFSSYLSAFDGPPLYVASRPPLRSTTIIPVLLQHGSSQNPNATSLLIAEGSPGLAFLHRVSPWSNQASGQDAFHPALSAGLFSLFLAHGADANAFSGRLGLTAFGIFLTALFAETPLDAKAYLRTLDDFFDAGGDVYGVARSIGWAVYERSGKFMFKLHLGGGRTPEDDDGDEDEEEEDVEWMEEEGAAARGGVRC